MADPTSRYGVLTLKNSGAYELPLTREFTRPEQVTVEKNGFRTIHPKSIWTIWTNRQLQKVGLCRIADATSVPAGKERTSTLSQENLTPGMVTRKFTLRNIPVAGPRRSLSGRVNSIRDDHIEGGLTITHGGSPYVLETDRGSRINVSGLAAAIGAGLSLPLNADGTVNTLGTGTHISWRTKNNTDLLLDATAFLSVIGRPLLYHVNNCHLAARAHKLAISTLTSVEAAAYDLEAGWPPSP